MSYNELKELLESEYLKYFEILDLEMQIRSLQNQYKYNKEEIEKELNKNLDNAMETAKILATNKSIKNYEFYNHMYEKKLKIYNEIRKK